MYFRWTKPAKPANGSQRRSKYPSLISHETAPPGAPNASKPNAPVWDVAEALDFLVCPTPGPRPLGATTDEEGVDRWWGLAPVD